MSSSIFSDAIVSEDSAPSLRASCVKREWAREQHLLALDPLGRARTTERGGSGKNGAVGPPGKTLMRKRKGRRRETG
jgi:hypothetical protein